MRSSHLLRIDLIKKIIFKSKEVSLAEMLLRSLFTGMFSTSCSSTLCFGKHQEFHSLLVLVEWDVSDAYKNSR